jgi:hypothetical protein
VEWQSAEDLLEVGRQQFGFFTWRATSVFLVQSIIDEVLRGQPARSSAAAR